MKTGWILLMLLMLFPWFGSARADSAERTVQNQTDFCAAFRELADGARTSFTITLPKDVFSRYVDRRGSGWIKYFTSCGVTHYQVSVQDQGASSVLHFTAVKYYDGPRIWAALQGRATASLSAADQRTLRKAQDVVAGIRGTEAQRVRQIHDWLCSHVTYMTDADPDNENDRAIGALLYGRADCDGYSDAFWLLCRLSGIEAGLVSGDAQGERVDGDAGHMWNTVRIGGQWSMIDVTWDDKDDGTSYLYYCIGTDRMRLDHTWYEPLPGPVPGRADRPELAPEGIPVVPLGSMAQADRALAGVVSAKAARFVITGSRLDKAGLEKVLSRGGMTSWTALSSPGGIEYTNVNWYAASRYCERESDAVNWINSFRQGAGAQEELVLYFSPALGRTLFAQERAGLKRLIYSTRLAAPVEWRYSEQDYRLIIQRPVFLSAALPSVGSAGALARYLDSALASRPTRLEFALEGAYAGTFQTQEFFDMLFSRGVSNVDGTYHLGDVRVLVQQLRYYPEYRITASRQEALSYLRECRRRGISSCRVYLPDSLYRQLMANDGQGVFDLLREAGLSVSTFNYNDAYRVIILGGG